MTVRVAWSILSGCLAAFLSVGLITETMAEENLTLITFGKDAPTREGDFNHAQSIYFSVPEGSKERLWINVFDPGIGSDYDQLMNLTAESQTRFAVFGGAGAALFGSLDPRARVSDEEGAGTLISEMTFGTEPESIGDWRNIALVDPRQGDAVAGRRVFRLLVQGISGDAGNVFGVAVSNRESRRSTPAGLEIYSYRPTVNVQRAEDFAELRFHAPADTDRLVVHNFDAAHGRLDLTTDFRTVPLKASGQDEWQSAEIPLVEELRSRLAAINFGGGAEMPNDATFMIADGNGRPIRVELPIGTWPALARPRPIVDQTALSRCGSMAFDAGRSIDPKGGKLEYLWHFGDGASAPGPAVRHDYANSGRYVARLEARGSSGQVGDAAASEFEVRIKAEPLAAIAAPKVAAAGATVTFDGARSQPGDAPIRNWSWRFNDGVVLTGATVRRGFDRPGRYLATLTLDDGSALPCNSASAQATVLVNAAPVPVAGSDRRVSVGETIAFAGSQSFDPDGRIIAYRWDFGDGAIAHASDPSHAYEVPGTYTVTLSVTDDAGVENSVRSTTTTIIVNALPLAVAEAVRAAAVDEPVAFDGSASRDADGHILSWNWNFGDGSRGSGQKATYAFAKPGTYVVSLMVRDNSGTRTDAAEVALTVRVNDPPIASAGPDQLVTASLVSFDSGGSLDRDGSIARYDWDFGDGTIGSGLRPTHVYAATGRYQVRLKVTDDSGTRRASAEDTAVVVVNARPIADPGPDRTVSPGEKVVFDASRSLDPDGDIAGYRWEFRDGADADGRIVSHVFEKPGVYPVRLTVADDTGHAGADDSREARIHVNAAPVAVAGGDLVAAPGDSVRLSASSSFDPDGRIAAFRWDFSDGSDPALGSDVTRIFAKPGIYTARLTVTDSSGAANGTDAAKISIAVNHPPSADAGGDLATEDLIVSLDGGRSVDPDGDALTYRWDFGDGSSASGALVQHAYAVGGTYPIILTVDDGKALANSMARAATTLTIHKAPVAVAGDNRDVCTGEIITFDGSRSRDPQGGSLRYQWEFGDGTGAAIVNPTKIYRKAGVYPVTLRVQDASTLPNNSHTNRISVKVDQGPIAEAGPDIEACAMSSVTFSGARSFDPNGTIKRFDWDFGDGRFATGEQPTHVYERPGEYRAFLKVEGQAAGRCDPYSTDELMVRILPGPIARIDARRIAPVGMEVVFDGSRSIMPGGGIKSWRWTFDDGHASEGMVVKHSFASPGRKTVTMTLLTDSASPTCSEVQASHVIDINSPPVPDLAMSASAAAGEEVLFDAGASMDPDGAISRYEWTFGDGGTEEGVSVRHRFEKAGNYGVRLKVSDEAQVENSSAVAERTIRVSAPPEPRIELPAAACTGETVRLAVTGAGLTSVRPVEAEWQASGEQNGVHSFTRRFSQPGRYDVTVMTDDGQGLGNSRSPKTRILKINRPPVSLPGPQRMVCPGDEVALDGSRSYDSDGRIMSFRWDFGDGSGAGDAKVSHRFDKPGTYDVRLAVTDDTGSSCASTVATTQVVVNAPPSADVKASEEVYVGGAADAALLDGSGSRDPDGQALSHVWTIGDGTSESGERVRHLYRSTGDIPVELTVTDTSGLSCATDTRRFVVKVRSRSPPAEN